MAPNNYGAAPEPAAPNPATPNTAAPNPASLPREQSFSEAFSAGRAAHGGGGGVFSYNGKDYSTDLKEESLMTANSGGSIQHLNFGDWVKNALGMGSPEVDDEALLNNSSQSIDEMARQSLQEDVNNSWFKRDARDKLTKFDQGMLSTGQVPSPEQLEPTSGSALNTSLRSFFSPIGEAMENNPVLNNIGNAMENNPLKEAIATGKGEMERQKQLQSHLDQSIANQNFGVPGGNNPFVPPALIPPAPQIPQNYNLLSASELAQLADLGDDNAIAQLLANENIEDVAQDTMSSAPPDMIDLSTPILAPVDVLEKNTYAKRDVVETTQAELTRLRQIQKTLGTPGFASDQIETLEQQLAKDQAALLAAQGSEQAGAIKADEELRLAGLERPEIIATEGLPETNVEPKTDAERNAAKKLGNKQMVQTMNQKLDGIIKAEGPEKPDPKVKDLPDVAENSSEIPEAKSALKDFFGDIFDKKELMRAAVMYLGARATGLSGNQALAFAGKQYISRSDAKENTYQKVALAGKHTKKTLALYKKSMNPNDLILKGVSLVNTGVTEERFDVATGQRFTGMKMKDPTTGSIRLMMPDGVTPVNFQTSTTDARYAQGSVENDAYNTRLSRSFATRVTEFQELDKNRTTGETKAERTPYLQITPSSFADAGVSYMLANGVKEQAMTGIMSNIYNEMVTDAKDGKLKNINESAIEGYFQRSWIESQTKNASAFMLADQTTPVPVANVRSFFDTLRNVGKGNGIEIMNDTQFSTWLMKQDAYLDWVDMDPEDKKEYNDTGSKLPPKDRKSGMMVYMLQGLTD